MLNFGIKFGAIQRAGYNPLIVYKWALQDLDSDYILDNDGDYIITTEG